MSGESQTARRVEAFCERGWATVPDVLSPPAVERLRAAVDALWRARGAPPLFSQQDVVLDDRSHVSPVGMTVFGVLEPIPEVAAILLEPSLLELLHGLLGPALEIELSAAVTSDASRLFFFWHNHVGGIDGADFRGRDDLRFDRVERVAVTTYLAPLDDDHGVMLLQPRRLGDPIAPPHEPGREPWPGCVEQRCAAGTTVVLHQTTWHAVTPMRVQGRRAFVSFFVRRAGLPATLRSDPTVAPAIAAEPELRRWYAAAPTMAAS